MGAIPDMDNVIKISRFFDCSLDDLMNNEIEDTNRKTFFLQNTPQTVPAKRTNLFSLITGGIVSGLGVIGLLVIGILSSVYPAIIYEPQQDEMKTIIATGCARC